MTRTAQTGPVRKQDSHSVAHRLWQMKARVSPGARESLKLSSDHGEWLQRIGRFDWFATSALAPSESTSEKKRIEKKKVFCILLLYLHACVKILREIRNSMRTARLFFPPRYSKTVAVRPGATWQLILGKKKKKNTGCDLVWYMYSSLFLLWEIFSIFQGFGK